MTDRLTIMSWLEGLAQDDWRECHSDSEVQEIARQTLAMLKEQEPVKPKYTPKSIYSWECGVCAEPFDRIANYCPKCGRSVRWE